MSRARASVVPSLGLCSLAVLLAGCDGAKPGGDDTGAHTGDPADSADTGDSGDSAETGDSADTGETGETADDPCVALQPRSDPAQNRENIEACLAGGRAVLAPGTFTLDAGVLVPPGANLRGDGPDLTTLRLVNPGQGAVVTLQGGSELTGLTLDGDGNLTAPYVNAALVITGDDNDAHDLVLGNRAQSAAGVHDQGVYFVDPTSTGNLVRDAELSNTFYGVIFVAGLPEGSGNRIQNSVIHQIRCDSVTLVGFGEVVGNLIQDTGWDCENGPIPGGGVYSLWNTNGGLVQENTIHDTCGHGIDFDTTQRIQVLDNHIYDPGSTFGGAAPWCVGAAGVAIIDSAYTVVRGNVVENNDRPNNAGWDPNDVFHARGAADFSDLPFGASTVLALAITQRPGSPGTAIGNVVDDNELRAACTSGCGGVGYFFSRGTGTDASGGWSAHTTNYITRNDPYGSNWGSKRCGGNWYAAGSTCPGGEDCNGDDDQHTFDWARNDDCRDY